VNVADYVTSYALANDIEPQTAAYLKFSVRALDKWFGHQTELSELSDDLLNRWITARIAAGISRKTVRTQRGAILTLWRAAEGDRLIDTLPRKVKLVKVPVVNPDAWWPDEVARLLAAAERAPGRFRGAEVSRADYLRAWLLVGYYTLLRPGDMRRLQHANIAPDGAVLLTQAKTGRPVQRLLYADALAAISKIRGKSPLVFPLSKCTTDRWWKWLKANASVPGSQKWLRRTGATACEIQQPGSAMQALGHKTAGLAYKSYVDARQTGQRPVTPPRVA
jgi:integrase